MDELLRFGYGDESYIFDPTKQVSIQNVFGGVNAKSNTIMGLDGGVYLNGYDRSQGTIGTAQVFFYIFAEHPNDMATLRREILKMKSWGPKQLIVRQQDGVQVWTWAVVTDIQMAQTASKRPHKYQQVQVNFHCPLSHWFGHGVELFDDADSILSDGLPTISPKVDRVDKGNGDTVDVTNNGDAIARAYIRWEAPAGVTITNPTISRDNAAGLTVDSVQYTDTLNPGDLVDIDGRNHKLYENSTVVPSYDKLTALHGGWLEIPPGTHTLDIAGTFSGGDGKLTIDVWDTYY